MQSFRSIIFGIVASLCIFFLVTALLFRSIDQQSNTHQWIEHTYQVINLLEILELNMQKAEANESNYLLTRNESFFEDFQKVAGNISLSLDKVKILTSDNPKQQKQIQSLDPILFERLHFLQTQLEIVYFAPSLQNKQSKLKIQSLLSEDKINTYIESLKQEEFRLLKKRMQQAEETVEKTLLLSSLSFLISFLMIASGLYLISQTFRKRKKAEEDLQDLNNLLEEKVKQRTVELSEREAYLSESEEKFKQLAENIPDIFWIREIESGKLIYISPSSEIISGRNPQFFERDPNAFLEGIHPEDREKAPHWPPKPPFDQTYSGEYRILRPDGSLRWISWKSFPVRNLEGVIYRRAGVASDITQDKEAEALRIEIIKEKELNEFKLKFCAMASHEFRTPLNIILLSAQILESNLKDCDEKQKRNVLRIIGTALSMNALLQKILMFLRVSEIQFDFSPKKLDTLKLCDQVIEETRLSMIKAPNFNVEVVGEEKVVFLDEDLAKNILRNLMTNAVKYSSPEKTIKIKIGYEQEEIILSVQDEGIGIPQKDLEKIFEPFQRGSNVDQTPGTGLGLATVKASVSRHGGSLSVESEEGKYTIFTVRLPTHGFGDSSSPPSEGKSFP
jgi:PAS domain S-box-containing protein